MATQDGQRKRRQPRRQWTPDRRGLVLRGAALAALGITPFLAGERRAPGGDAVPAAYPWTARAAAGHWARPVAGDYRVTAAYGIPGNWQAGRHTGIDFAMPVGTPVYSVGSGTVVFAGRSGAYGKAATIRMDDDHYTLFAHLSELSVRTGDRVRAGSRVGSSGATGRVTGPHLHFEVRTGRGYGSDVDPVAYLARRGVQLV
ncbi:MAG TPA: M23 family metallopeptidase [Streptomyces sp.]|uniref:M23 family metallopeptidase n=1 Tax=Streptomyces sp. TaxID=1931 RepID=UPI002D5AFC1E|nr:M23 family metallopeptidase [Streptomyces sp.]HZG04819.1 M23 family metallopeptidase [Streptomyces sp.]